MNRWVEINFDCLPLRSISRLDVPLDASPKFREQCQRIKAAMERHGSHNSYYLHNASCIYHLINDEFTGLVQFRFEGTVLTDESDARAVSADLLVQLQGETCSWLTEPIVDWFRETVRHAVICEFGCYIQAGDLEKAKQRLDKIQEVSDESEGFLGMYL